MEKKKLRTQILQKRDALSEVQRYNYSEMITQKVLNLQEYKKAQKILLFASFRSEVDTLWLTKNSLKDGKEVYFPTVQQTEDGRKEMEFYRVTSEKDLEAGYYGILEPKENLEYKLRLPFGQTSTVFEEKSQTRGGPQKELILIIVPGTVFDKKGHRIGYGGGFYDRFLTELENETRRKSELAIWKMAIAYECQMVDTDVIPLETHDIRVNVIVTEQNVYECLKANI